MSLGFATIHARFEFAQSMPTFPVTEDKPQDLTDRRTDGTRKYDRRRRVWLVLVSLLEIFPTRPTSPKSGGGTISLVGFRKVGSRLLFCVAVFLALIAVRAILQGMTHD